MINKIIINGRGGAGKDEVANYLVNNYGFTRVAFADPIYEIAYKYFGMKAKDRWLLQQIGQKFREICPTIWIDLAMKYANQFERCVISDLRQHNEYSIALENGFLPIRLSADLDLRIDRIWKRDGKYPDVELLENESETGADKYRYFEIDNNGVKEDLYKNIDSIIEKDLTEYIKNLQMEFTLRQMY